MENKATILAIDDNEDNLFIIEAILEDKNFNILFASNGEDGIEVAKKNIPDLILLDIMMPGLSGYETAQFILNDPALKHTPILFLSALDDVDSKVDAFNSGGVDYVPKPFHHEELLSRINTHLELSQLRNNLQNLVDLKTQELQRAYEEALTLLSVASEYRDYETGMHNNRLGLYAALLAKKLGWSDTDYETILFAAPLHDVGKIGIPDSILHKEGPLDNQEWITMREHTTIGETILNSKSQYNSLLKMAAKIAACHHETYDGTGYPKSLRSDEIPMAARITSLCDVYDALRSARPYKKGFSHQKTIEIISQGDSRTRPEQFDPIVLEQFLLYEKHFEEIFEIMSDDSSNDLVEQYKIFKQQW